MYPNLSYILHDLIGTARDNGFAIVQTFGLFLALGTLTAGLMLKSELRRRAGEGQFHDTTTKVWIGRPPTVLDIASSALFGFILGWKVPPLITGIDQTPADFLLSMQGNVALGIGAALLLGGLRYHTDTRAASKQGKPREVTAVVHPWNRWGDIAIVAALSGIVGAKVFGVLEVPPSTFAEFVRQIFSGQGLAIFGGLIAGFFGVWWYMRRHGLAFWPMADAIAPGMLVGVGVGRIGCQLAGDGDWGIDNTAPLPSGWFLPEWMWAYRYPHNVLNEGVPIPGCVDQYCAQLATPVYPTPFYEVIMLVGLGLLLWVLRKRAEAWPGLIMGLYLVANGVERFFIEKIRVNATYDLFGYQPTQAELIAVVSVLLGVALCAWTYTRGKRPYPAWV